MSATLGPCLYDIIYSYILMKCNAFNNEGLSFFRNSLNLFMKQPKPILTHSEHMLTSTEYRVEGKKPILQVKEELSKFYLAVWLENSLNLDLCVLSVYAQSCLNTFLKNTNRLSVLYWLPVININITPYFFNSADEKWLKKQCRQSCLVKRVSNSDQRKRSCLQCSCVLWWEAKYVE